MKRSERNKTLKSIRIITLATMVLIASDVFFVSVRKVHVHSGTDLSAYADSANTVTETIRALRGNIYDSNGNIIAQDNKTYNIICVLDENRPSVEGEVAYVKDKEYTAEKLAEALGMDYETVLGFLNQDVYQTELGNAGRNLSQSKKEEIEALKLPGIEFEDSVERIYPNGTFASNLIGYAQADENGNITGKMGLELYLDSYLEGTNGSTTYQVDKDGYVLPGMKEETTDETNGNDVYLTINQSIQTQLESSMSLTNERFSAEAVWGAVMEVDTGKILAWGQSPSFNPNDLDITEYTNYGSQYQYEPGSTLKTFTWVAAINEGLYNGSTIVDGYQYCYTSDTSNNPYRTTEDNSFGCIYNSHHRDYSPLDLDTGFKMSANTAAVAIETEMITPETYLNYLKAFGFFKEVNTDGIPEVTGTLNFTWPGDKLNLSFGQSSSVTMLQMLQAYSAIMGDGNMVKPYVVESIRDSYDSSKVIYQAETEVTGTPITAESAEKMRELMYLVVNDEGTGKGYQIPECKLIAKTGTAEVAINGEISEDTTIVSLMAGMPADDPQVIVYYCFRAPVNDNAAYEEYYTEPIVNLLRKVAVTLGLNSSTDTTNDSTNTTTGEKIVTTDMPSLVNHSVDYAQTKLLETNANVIVLGEGSTVIDQYPSSTSSVSTGQRVFLLTDTNSFTMPDLTGWTRKDVAALWSVTGFSFELSGNGIVTSQSVPAGTVVTKGTNIQVVFSE